MSTPIWVGEYIGLPFKEKGRSRAGIDCWGLVRLIYSDRYGVRLFSYKAGYKNTQAIKDLKKIFNTEHKFWEPIEPGDEKIGDVIVLRVSGAPVHVGVVIGEGKMLHVERGTNASITPYKGMRWKHRVVGFYRHKNVGKVYHAA